MTEPPCRRRSILITVYSLLMVNHNVAKRTRQSMVRFHMLLSACVDVKSRQFRLKPALKNGFSKLY